MYIWYNTEIIDPDTNSPFDNKKKPWSLIYADKLKFLYQLTNFKLGKYRGTSSTNGDPEVTQLRWLTTDELNNKFSTPSKRIRFPKEVWDKLINAVPAEWTSTLLSGNQTFHNDEYLATVIGKEIGDVYRYKNGRLYYYQWDDRNEDVNDDMYDNIKPTIYNGTPGQANNEGDYPSLQQLKRVKVSDSGEALTVLAWYLSDYTKDKLINGGITPNMFAHELGGSMHEISKKWRAKQFNTRHTDISEFCLKVFKDPDYDLSKVTKTLRNIPITDINRDNMYKIMNKGLYMGKVAHDYLTSKKGMGIGSPKLVPSHCIYTAHVYDPLYIPSQHKPTSINDLTYDFAFGESMIAIAMWDECKFVANAIGIDITIDKWYDIFGMLDIQYTKANLTIHDLIRISLIIQTISCIYNTYKTLTDDFLKGLVTDFLIDHVIEVAITQLHKHFTTIILLTPAMQRFLHVHSTVVMDDKVLSKYTQRERESLHTTYLPKPE